MPLLLSGWSGTGPREQMNQASAYIDLSNIYATTTREHHGWIRDHDGGYLRSPTEKDGRYMLLRSTDADDGCNRHDMLQQGRYCFKAGQPLVTVDSACCCRRQQTLAVCPKERLNSSPTLD